MPTDSQRSPDIVAYDRFVATHINASPLVRWFKTLTVLRSLAHPVSMSRR